MARRELYIERTYKKYVRNMYLFEHDDNYPPSNPLETPRYEFTIYAKGGSIDVERITFFPKIGILEVQSFERFFDNDVAHQRVIAYYKTFLTNDTPRVIISPDWMLPSDYDNVLHWRPVEEHLVLNEIPDEFLLPAEKANRDKPKLEKQYVHEYS
jgi:hypothetical protein